MSASTQFEIRASVRGIKEVDNLRNAIRQLKTSSKPAELVVTQLQTAAKKLGTQSDVTENQLRTSVNVLKELRANVSLTGTAYKKLTTDIQKAELALNKATAAGKKSSLSLKGAAKGLGAIAAGGIFGGPEGAIGGAIGLAMGGPYGAAAGAAVGAQVGIFRKAISGTAEYSAALGLQRKALRLVIADTKAYTAAQGFLQQKSEALAIPQDVITRQFTALTASVKGAGKSTEDAQTVFEAIASGIRGTGGSLEDMKAAMTATAQVFSKGKVSAEELRQQLGERLPGAFTIFAESMGKTPAELDKALEGGKVTLDDFMKFADTLFKKYGKNAEILAAGPEAAGDRLRTAMSSLKDNVGQLLQPVGSAFQDTFTDVVKQIDGAAKALRNFLKIGEEHLEGKISAIKEKLKPLEEKRAEIKNRLAQRDEDRDKIFIFRDIQELEQITEKYNLISKELITLEQQYENITGKTKEAKKEIESFADSAKKAFASMKQGAETYFESINNFSKQIEDATVNAFKGMEDALVNFVKTGKLNFAELTRSILADLTRMIVKAQLLAMFESMKTLFSPAPGPSNAESIWTGQNLDKGMKYWDTTLPVPNANGNVYGENGIVPFAYGGVVDKPTLFPFAKGGVGLMAEAGSPEAIMPLKRGPSGRLGVEAAMDRYSPSSSGINNVSVNYEGDVLQFNNEDYVRKSDVGAIINAAANAGESRTMKSLKNSRSQRAMIGL